MLNKFITTLFIFVSMLMQAQTEKKANSEPQYPGGRDAMEGFIESRQQLVFGNEKDFLVECMVSVKGKITVIQVSSDSAIVKDKTILKEINDIINAMPAWITAKVNGTPVAKNVTLEINYYSIMLNKKDAAENIDLMPKFPGGEDALGAYLSTSVKYPPPAMEKNIQGIVNVEFVVRKDGKITDAKVANSIGFGCDEEALRVVNAMPLWTPAKLKGKAINVYYKVPVSFLLK